MENNKDQEPEIPGQDPMENLSGEDILNKIDKDATEVPEEEEHREGYELLKRLGLSRKDKVSKAILAEKKENTVLKHKMAELHDKYVRLHAEFDNFKKRSMKERIEFSKIANLDVIMSLLP